MDQNTIIYKVGTGRFICGDGVIQELEREAAHFGRALIIGGPGTVDIVAGRTELEKLGAVYRHEGACSRNHALRYAAIAREQGCAVIIGIGGGKCMDLAKCAATYGNLPIITVPTSIATCVATSAVCIMYTDKGASDGSVPMNREVDVCIADYGIIAEAPRRLLAAGMVDSLAKLPEVIHNLEIHTYRDCDLAKYICNGNSRIIWEYIMGEGKNLYHNGRTPEDFAGMVLTNLLHTSVVSGFSVGSGQLALAHGLYDFMRREYTEEALDILHGELVGVGLIMQMYYNGCTDGQVRELREFMEEMEMPLTLSDIHFPDSEHSRSRLVDYLSEKTLVTDRCRLEHALGSIAVSK